MKQIISAAILLLLLSTQAEAQKYFKIVDAYSSAWVGGTPMSGSGTNYTVKIVLLTTQKVTFNDFWVKNDYGTPEVLSASYADGRKLSKGDTVLVRYTTHVYPPNSPMLQIPKPEYKKPPIPIQGEALLGFTIGRITRYRSVPKFTESKEIQSYP